jgi:hypothetical protein
VPLQERLRSHPLNLIRVIPAKGDEIDAFETKQRLWAERGFARREPA